MIYLDNAATTFPKPGSVLERMVETYGRLGVSPGRGGYDLAVEAEELVDGVRRRLAGLLGAPSWERVVFGANATDALNLAIQGLVRPGGRVISSRLEHNSVLRPLHHLRRAGLIDFDLVPFDGQGFLDPEDFAWAVRPETCLVVASHASNVLGTVQPLAEIGRVCAERGLPLLVDAAQSAGLVEIDLAGWRAGAVAFTGHKSLLGPTGVGGLAVSPGLEIGQSRFGGTGIDSDSPVHTPTYPHRLEAGTLNLLGIIGLGAGLDSLAGEGQGNLHRREMALWTRLRDGLAGIKGVRLLCAGDSPNRLAVLTMTLEGWEPSDVGAVLDADFDLAVRVGLHCAPLVHRDLGTWPRGGVRFSLGPFNTDRDIDQAVRAVAALARRKR